MEHPPRYERIRSIKKMHEKAKIIFFRPLGFADWFVGLKGYSKFAPKPF